MVSTRKTKSLTKDFRQAFSLQLYSFVLPFILLFEKAESEMFNLRYISSDLPECH